MLELSPLAQSLKPGIYEHYKGNQYRVLGVAHHSETHEELVIYQRVDDGGLWARPLEMFVENVEVNGVKRPRFRFMSEQM